MLDVQQVWQDTLDFVKKDLNTPTFKTWFEQTTPLGIINQEMVVSVENDFARDWLETRYTSLLSTVLTEVTGSPMAVRFKVLTDAAILEPVLEPVLEQTLAEAAPAVTPPIRSAARDAEEGELSPKHTFDSFVVGSSNQFSYHVALAVAETPGSAGDSSRTSSHRTWRPVSRFLGEIGRASCRERV